MRAYVIAMDCEAACVRDRMADAFASREYGRTVVSGRLGGERVLLVVSGVGKSNAAAATQFAIQSGADEIVNLGVCGGFEPQMKIGDLYEVDRAVQYDFDLAQLNGTAVGVLNERTSPYIPLRTTGRHPAKTLATGDHFNDNTADLPLLASLGAGLRDMEGAAVAHVCETAGVPCRALKCVTNVLGAGATGQYAENLARCLAVLAEAAADF
ncbi:MAG: 5'-methylthioadenosine/S-adenosylhomocysteine nucleosidase [Kiritimatiellae bacterium]|nr:5'-methylthioadenosine/S-adenosylhomocysteine nucleosidase [Kiritimatiellia bacterium]